MRLLLQKSESYLFLLSTKTIQFLGHIMAAIMARPFDKRGLDGVILPNFC